MAIISLEAAICVLDKLVKERAYSGVQEIAWDEVKAALQTGNKPQGEICADNHCVYCVNAEDGYTCKNCTCYVNSNMIQKHKNYFFKGRKLSPAR